MSYEPKKAAQLISYLIMKSGKQYMNVVKAVKLVYLVDRESIRRCGFPVLDDNRFSMPLGPVNSETYRCIQGEFRSGRDGWSSYLEDRENHNIALANPSATLDDLDELSDADIEFADAVWAQFGALDQWQLVDWTHDPKNVPEWEDPNGGSTPIPLKRILHSVGVPDADEFAEMAESFRAVDQVFDRLRA